MHNRGRSRQCTCLGQHVRLHHDTRIFSPQQLRGRQFTWRHCFHGSKHGISTLTLWEAGRVVQPLLPSSATAAYSRQAVRRRRAGTRRLRFRLGLVIQLGLAFVWVFSCTVAILTAVEAISAVGVSVGSVDLSLDFSWESMCDFP